VPVTINYDRCPEQNAFPGEMLGQAKVKESFGALLSAWGVVRHRHGTISLKFAEPISTRDFIRNQQQPPDSPQLRQEAVRELSRLVMQSLVSNLVVVTPAMISAFLLQRRSPVVFSDITEGVSTIRRLLFDRHVEVQDGSQDIQAVTRKALDLVLITGGVVVAKNEGGEETYAPSKTVERLSLAYYRNQLMHAFVHEAAVVLCIQGRRMTPATLWERYRLMRQLIDVEFVFPVGTDARQDLALAVSTMLRRGLLVDSEGSQTMAAPGSASSGVVEVAVSPSDQAAATTTFFAGLLCPFIDAAWATALSLSALLLGDDELGSGTPVVGTTLLERAQRVALGLLGKGIMVAFEAASLDTLRNSLTFLQNFGVITRRGEKGEASLSRRGMIELAPEYNSMASLQGFVDELHSFRESGSTPVALADLRRILDANSRL